MHYTIRLYLITSNTDVTKIRRDKHILNNVFPRFGKFNKLFQNDLFYALSVIVLLFNKNVNPLQNTNVTDVNFYFMTV